MENASHEQSADKSSGSASKALPSDSFFGEETHVKSLSLVITTEGIFLIFCLPVWNDSVRFMLGSWRSQLKSTACRLYMTEYCSQCFAVINLQRESAL